MSESFTIDRALQDKMTDIMAEMSVDPNGPLILARLVSGFLLFLNDEDHKEAAGDVEEFAAMVFNDLVVLKRAMADASHH